MKRKLSFILLSLCLAVCSAFAFACGDKASDAPALDFVYQIQNGGFETGDLTGWTVEGGNAYSDDCVATVSEFGFADDNYTARIKINQTGNWHLYGKAFDGSYESQRTGSLRSQTFTLAGEGTISLKLAGGSRFDIDGNEKPEAEQCFVGVYRASDDRLLYKQRNEYFVKHENGVYDPSKYDPELGSLATDNYLKYTVYLKQYLGEQLYLRIVDPDPDMYYGYLSVDDIRTYSEAGAQAEGPAFVKVRTPSTVEIPRNDVANGGFETGDIAGWTVTEGDAFSHAGVCASPTFWKERIPFDRDGAYHFGFYNPTATGRMRTNVFTLSGSGWVSYKLGGCLDNGKTYIRIMQQYRADGETKERELGRVSNFMYKDIQFPYVQNGLRLANMVQYYLDLSAYLGTDLFFEAVDENTDANEMACIVLDSVKAYYENKPDFATEVAFEAKPDLLLPDDAPDSPHQVKNGTFETGDLTGWTVVDSAWGNEFVTGSATWWGKYPYNRNGAYHFATFGNETSAHEERTGTMYSEPFVMAGEYMTYRMGGNGGYLAIREMAGDSPDLSTDTELARYYNHGFRDGADWDTTLNVTVFLANMIAYKADISAFAGKTVYLVVCDDATSNWGHIELDSIITYHESEPAGVFRPALLDKSGLKAEIDKATAIQKGDYTDASFKALQDAVKEAQDVYGNGRSHADKVAEATANLQKAQSGLTLKVPARTDADATVTVRNGGSVTVDVRKFINENGLTLTYTATCGSSAVSLGDITDGRFTVAVAASDGYEEGQEVGKITLGVLYKGEEKLTAEIAVCVTLQAPFTVSDATHTVDLYDNKGEDVTVDLTQFVTKTTDISLTYAVKEVNGLTGITVGADGTLTAQAPAVGEGAVTVTVTGTDAGGSLVQSFVLTLGFINTEANRMHNGGFDIGDDGLDGWTRSNPDIGAVNDAETYWAENIKFNADGAFFNAYAVDKESAMGTLTSPAFTVGGSGYITYKYGAARNSQFVYLEVADAETNAALIRFGNNAFRDVAGEAVRGCTLMPYIADLRAFIGKRVYIRICDYAFENYGLFFADSFVTYYTDKPTAEELKVEKLNEAAPVDIPASDKPADKYQVFNGDFETGTLEGWTLISGDWAGNVSKDDAWFNGTPYGKGGKFLYASGEGNTAVPDRSPNYEGRMGTMRSSTFTLRAGGWISFKMGGGGNPDLCYIRIVAENGTELARFGNTNISDGTLVQYSYHFADLAEDTQCYIEVVDNATGGWGLLNLDDIVTDYASGDAPENLPANAITATNRKP